MYSMSRFPNTKVADNWVEDEWQVEFKRSLTPTKYDDLLTLLSLLQSCHLTPLDDAIDWALEKNKSYSIKSLYSCLTDRGVRIRSSDSVWNVKVPLKIKVFLWQIDNNRLLTALSPSEGLEGELPLLSVRKFRRLQSHLLWLFSSLFPLVWHQGCLGLVGFSFLLGGLARVLDP